MWKTHTCQLIFSFQSKAIDEEVNLDERFHQRLQSIDGCFDFLLSRHKAFLFVSEKWVPQNVLSFIEGSGMKKKSANHCLDQADEQIQLNDFRFTIFGSSTVRCLMNLFQFRLFVQQMVTFFFKSMQLIRSFRFF